MKSNPAAVRLRKARREAARALGLDVKDWRCRRYGVLSVALINLENQLGEGRTVDVRQLVEIERAMQEIVATLPRGPLDVTVKFVEGDPKPATVPIDAKPVAEQPAKIEAPARPPAGANGPLKAKADPPPLTRDTGVSGSSFHSQQFTANGERPPLKRLQPPSRPGQQFAGLNDASLCWSAYGNRAQASDPIPTDPHPYLNSDGTSRSPWKARH